MVAKPLAIEVEPQEGRSQRPLLIELFAGLHGWGEGAIAEGFRVVGFDIVDMGAAFRVPRPEGIQLVIQDVLTIHGAQFKHAALIVASPPCQAYSYRAMPWKKAKALPPPDNTLFEACFRIQREAIEAAGHHIPLVVENVCGAQKWVGRARWHFGSFYLWGDIPALMPITKRAKVGGIDWSNFGKQGYKAKAFNGEADRRLRATKNDGGSWFNIAHNTTSGKGRNPDGRLGMSGLHGQDTVGASMLRGDDVRLSGLSGSREGTSGVKCASDNGRRSDVGNGVRFTSRDCGIENSIAKASEGHKQRGSGAAWWRGEVGSKSSKSNARKAASAHIAKIPYPLARHIAAAWKP